MGLLSWLVLGLVVGVVAQRLVPGRAPGGLLHTIVLGVVGALAGGALGSRLGLGTVTGINVRSLVVATGGAVIVLLLYSVIKRCKR